MPERLTFRGEAPFASHLLYTQPGVLDDTDQGAGFEDEAARRGVHMVFVITDSAEVYGSVRRALPVSIKSVHLYRNYLSNFEINTGKVLC